jgi:sterol 3beta-glucosyltransferase
MADQPFWGSRVNAVGVAPTPLRVNQLSVEKMVRAIAAAKSKDILKRAQVIGQEIRSEDGVMNAVRLIELCAMKFREST